MCRSKLKERAHRRLTSLTLIFALAVVYSCAWPANSQPDTPAVGVILVDDTSTPIKFLCTATLVNNTVAVTARHCVNGLTVRRIAVVPASTDICKQLKDAPNVAVRSISTMGDT